jgi:WD40 repeat protein
MFALTCFRWALKFSNCGRLLATAGSDNLVRVWVVRTYLNYFMRLREKYSQQYGNDSTLSHDFEQIQMQMVRELCAGCVCVVFDFSLYRKNTSCFRDRKISPTMTARLVRESPHWIHLLLQSRPEYLKIPRLRLVEAV